MATILPRAGAASVGSGGVRKAKLPDAGDVPIVQVANDPGVQVPDLGAASRGLQDLGAGVADFGQSMAAADDRIKTRQEALDRMRIKTAVREELRKVGESASRTGDLSAAGNAEAVGLEGRAILDQAMSSHGGRDESKAALAESLEAEFRTFSDTVAVRATEAGDARADAVAGEIISEGHAQAFSGANPNDLIDEFMRLHMSPGADLKASLRTGGEINVIRRYTQAVVTGSLDRLFAAGDAESIGLVQDSMNDPAVQRALGQKGQTEIFRRLEAVKRDQSALRTQPVKDIPREVFDRLSPAQQAEVLGAVPDETTINGVPERIFSQMTPKQQEKFLGIEDDDEAKVKNIPREIYDGLTSEQQERVLGAAPSDTTIKGIPEEVWKDLSAEQQRQIIGIATPEEKGAATLAEAGTVLGRDPNEQERQELADVAPGTPLVTIEADETAFLKGLGKSEAEEVTRIRTDARVAQRAKAEIERSRLAIESGRFTTGVFSDARVFLSRLAEFAGADEKTKDLLGDAATADTIDAASARLGIEVAQKLSRLTNMSLTFIERGLPGLARTPEGNRILLEVMDRTSDREIEIAAMAETFVNRHKSLRPENEASFFDKVADLEKNDPIITPELRQSIIDGSQNAPKSFKDIFEKGKDILGGDVPTFSTPEEVNDLPSGTEYIWGPDGKSYRKN